MLSEYAFEVVVVLPWEWLKFPLKRRCRRLESQSNLSMEDFEAGIWLGNYSVR